MNHVSTSGSTGALLGIVAILLLILGGAGFYWALARQQQAAAVAMERARTAEAEASRQTALARAQTARAARRAADTSSTPDGEGAIRTAVESVLRTQQAAWNRGDVDAFVEPYWKSDDVTFSSGGKTTRGWEETVRGYRERYPTPQAMGRLTFDNVEITPLGDAAALVLGEWRLERESEPLSGSFSLIFRHLDGRWVIVHDHTSRLLEPTG